jgi:hypothetical protein
VSPSLEAKRQNLLRSLASSLAALRHLKFDKLGSLSFPDGARGDPEIIPVVWLQFGGQIRDPDLTDADWQHEYTYEHSRDYLHRRLDSFIDRVNDNLDNLDTRQQELMSGLYDLCFYCC